MPDRIIIQLLILFLVSFLVGLNIRHALGQEHTHEGEVGHFYATWMIPPARQNSCCNLQDCYATQVKQVRGTWFFLHRETQEWKPLPESKLEHNQLDPRDSPDGMAHVCASSLGVVFCAVIGSQS